MKKEDLIILMSSLVARQKVITEVKDMLGFHDYQCESLDAIICDMKERAKVIIWEEKSTKIKDLQKKLENLLSNEAKTKKEIDNLGSLVDNI